LYASQAIVTKSRVYLLGGKGSSVTNKIYYADINSDGTLGAWQTDTNTLPEALSHSQAIVTKSRVYLLGGYNGSVYINKIYYADINSDGTLGAWQTDTNTLPDNLVVSQAIVTKSRVYLLGGYNGSSVTNKIYYTDIDNSGYLGSWTTDSNTLPDNLEYSQAIVTKSRVYLLGAAQTHFLHDVTNKIYYADIDSSGYLGSWTTDSNTLPDNLAASQAIVTKSHVYLLGGYISSITNKIYYAPFTGWGIPKNGYDVGISYTLVVPDQTVASTKAVIRQKRDRVQEINTVSYDSANDKITITYDSVEHSADPQRSIQVRWDSANANETNSKIQIDLWKS